MQPYDIRSKIQQLDLTVLKSPNDILCLQRIINKTDNDQKKTKKQAQRRAAADRSRHHQSNR